MIQTQSRAQGRGDGSQHDGRIAAISNKQQQHNTWNGRDTIHKAQLTGAGTMD